MSDVKRCSHCGRVLPVGSFYRSSMNTDGYQCWCKDCQRACNRSSSRRAGGSRSTSSESSSGGGNLGLLSKADMRAQNIKLCTCCQTVKPLSAFSSNSRNADGHQSWCKSCCASYAKARNKSRVNELHNKAVQDGLALHVPSRRVVARNGVSVSGEPVPKNLKPLLSVGGFSGSPVSAPTVTTELSTDGTPPLDSKDAVNPLFSGISSRELLEELQARGFDLRGACHVEIRVVRSAVKL